MQHIRKITYWFLIPVLACALLFVLEQVLMVDYTTKSIAKLLLFLGIPFCTSCLVKRRTGKKEQNKLVGFATEKFLPGLIIGASVIGVILIAYLLIQDRIDSTSIIAELNEKSGITRQTYLLTGLYISFVNSFLEENFFRRYIFWNLYHHAGLKHFAYIGSSLLFSIYHLAIFQTWFSPFVMLLALLGLMAAGLFLNYMVQRTNSLLSSWIIHLCANIAIIGIGYTWM